MKYVDMMKVNLGIARVVTEAPSEGGTTELKPKLKRSWSCKEHQTSISGREKNHCKEHKERMSLAETWKQSKYP